MHSKTIRLFRPTTTYIIWWTATALTFLVFDILFCCVTSFHAFHNYTSTYFTILAGASIFTLPAAYLKRQGWQFGVLIALDILFIANLMYCRTYFVAIPLDSYCIADNLCGFVCSVTDAFRFYDLILPLIAATAYLLTRQKKQTRPGGLLQPALSLMSLGLVFATMYPAGGVYKKLNIMATSVNSVSAITPAYSVFGSMAYDYMTRCNCLTENDSNKMTDWLSEHNKLTSGYHSPLEPRRRNIVVILCESLESWPIGLSLEGREITPFINSLIKDSTTFYIPDVLTQTRGGRSIDAQLLMLAGQTPTATGVFAMKYSGNEYNTLPKEMRRHGAATYLISPDEPSTWNQKAIAQSFGIDSIYMNQSFDHNLPNAVNMTDGYLTDKSLLEQATEKMKSGEIWPENQYAFILIVTHSGHNPFKLDEDLKTISLTDCYPDVLKDYLTAAHFTDNSLRSVISYIKSRPDYDNTSIIITGDHEGLAVYRKCLSEYYSYVSPNQYTPLIILNTPTEIGETQIGGDNPLIIGQLDIYSTLLDIAGLYNSAEWKGMGRSAFDPERPNMSVSPLGYAKQKEPCDSSAIEHQRESFIIGDLLLIHRLNPMRLLRESEINQ